MEVCNERADWDFSDLLDLRRGIRKGSSVTAKSFPTCGGKAPVFKVRLAQRSQRVCHGKGS